MYDQNLSNGYMFRVGQNIGVIDNVTEEDEYVNWYKLIYIEHDDELPLAWLYMASEDPKKNVHLHKFGFYYADIRESTNPNLVVEA